MNNKDDNGITRRRDLAKTFAQRSGIVLLAVGLLCISKQFSSPDLAFAGEKTQSAKTAAKAAKSYTIGKHILKVTNNASGVASYSISLAGKEVFSDKLPAKSEIGECFIFMDPKDQNAEHWKMWGNNSDKVPFATDLSGDGVKTITVIRDLKAHVYFIKVIRLESDGARVVFESRQAGGSPTKWTDLNHDGKYQLIFPDETFVDWHTNEAQSPSPRVYLVWNGKEYATSAKLMKKAAPTPSENETMIKTIKEKLVAEGPATKAGNGKLISPAAWSPLIDLIYSGNAKTAKAIYDQLFPPKSMVMFNDSNKMSAESFWKVLIDKVKSSKLAYGAVKEVNGGDI